MKLLLTSAGISNASLAVALKELVEGDLHIAFIPTAANVEDGPKDWLIRDLVNCQKLGTVDVVDISAVGKEVWLSRLKKSNVIVFGGGDTAHLMRCIKKSGLQDELPELLKTRVYVGISAGSIVAGKTLLGSSTYIYGEKKDVPAGLGYVNFHVRPHLNSPHFPRVREEQLKAITSDLPADLYALDDNSAVLVVDSKLKIVSEGKWVKYPTHKS
ncbi:Type 1 glutamine amidotransferase-like domain-containing protein [Candidatus Woesearchaeota archaeon]|nr:Type 1 glutamine amidotransferase-like domain-containing protein [Candidatus Woesearchaeota archaeon]